MRGRHDGQAHYLGANARRMSTRTMHIARLPFPYWRDYVITSIDTVFPRRTPTASRAMRIFLTAIALLDYTGPCPPSIQPKFLLLCRYFQLVLQWREKTNHKLLGQAVLSRLGTVSISIISIRCLLSRRLMSIRSLLSCYDWMMHDSSLLRVASQHHIRAGVAYSVVGILYIS